MNARIWTATCGVIAAGAVAGLLAQAPQTPPSSESQSTKTVTVTGCVKRTEQQATGTSGAAGAAAAAAGTKFVLTNASIGTKGTSETAGTMGSTAPPATAVASEYRLDTDEATLTPHVGHKVEVTGTIERPERAEPKPPASAATAPTLKVDSVKMIASSCS
jgi:hypothetical protein